MATSTSSNADLIRHSFEALNRQDLATLRGFWTEDTVERFPDRTCRGADEIAAYFEDAFAAVSDWRMELLSLAEQGEDVFAQWRLTGRHTGTIQGIEPTGRPVAIDGLDHFVVRDGKVVSNFVVFDQIQYARQMGLLPEQDSAGDKALKAAFNAKTKVVEAFRR
jgi:ketosteroid isomerase-like protein